MKKNMGFITMMVFVAALMGILFCIFFNPLYGGIGAAAAAISAIIFRKETNSQGTKIAFLALIIMIWALAVIEHIGFLAFAVPLTIVFIAALISEKRPKKINDVPVSKYEKDSVRYIKILDKINLSLTLLMAGLCILSLFLIPYDLSDSGMVFVFVLTQSLILLMVLFTLYWGAIFKAKENTDKKLTGLAKTAATVAALAGKTYGFGLMSSMNDLKNQGISIFERRWSVWGFYAMLIIILPLSSFMLVLPEAYGVQLDSLWESFVYAAIHIPYVQANLTLFLIMVVVSFVPFQLSAFLREKTVLSVEAYKNVSLKAFFKRSLITGTVIITIAAALLILIFFEPDNSQSNLTKRINEQLVNIRNGELVITSEVPSIEFNDEDFSFMHNETIKSLGKEAAIKLISISDTETDASGEKYISATFAGYTESDNNITCFLFRKYLTESNYHKIGDMELYMEWISKSLTKDDLQSAQNLAPPVLSVRFSGCTAS